MEQRQRTLALDLRAAYEAGKLAARYNSRRSELFRPVNGRQAVAAPTPDECEREDSWHH